MIHKLTLEHSISPLCVPTQFLSPSPPLLPFAQVCKSVERHFPSLGAGVYSDPGLVGKPWFSWTHSWSSSVASEGAVKRGGGQLDTWESKMSCPWWKKLPRPTHTLRLWWVLHTFVFKGSFLD